LLRMLAAGVNCWSVSGLPWSDIQSQILLVWRGLSFVDTHAAAELKLAEMVILWCCHLAHACSTNQLGLLLQALCRLVLLPLCCSLTASSVRLVNMLEWKPMDSSKFKM